ncbi:MAG: thiamine-phosphate kinase [Acidobacteriota bacterium]
MRAEDRFVERLRLLLPDDQDLLIGPGDDAAVLRGSLSDVVLTTDLLVEGVDFLSGEDPVRLGRRAVAVSLSDSAAMGARPRFFLLSIALPAALGEDEALEICRGAIERGREHGATLVGGDLSRAPAVYVSVALWGELESPAVTRSGAEPGDVLWLTGFPGRAAAGLRIARRFAEAGGEARMTPGETELVDAFRDPRPPVELALELARAGCMKAAIDVSDGLGLDAGRLGRASGVRIVLERSRLPVSPALVAFAAAETADPIEWMVAGGDDYELLFAAPESAGADILRIAASRPVTAIGRAEVGEGSALADGGIERDVSELGHDHLEPVP